MCGIFAYLGKREAKPILLEGLKKLEYRGYDSAGLAVLSDRIQISKRVGKISEESFDDMTGTIGISHTRWATHGQVNVENAHPHTDYLGEVAIVHNGIIENAARLRTRMGVAFKSETDSEVIAHLLSEFYNGSLEKSMMKVMKVLKGSFAIAAVSRRERKIVGARKGSPLAVGFGEGEYFMASDTAPFLGHTESVAYPEEDSVVVIEDSGVSFYSTDGFRTSVEKKSMKASDEEASLGDFDTYMRKEIYEQPNVIRNNISVPLNMDFSKFDRIIFTACGTSWHACLVAKYLFKDHIVDVDYASEFRYRNPLIRETDLVVGVSQSGETADTLAALREAKRKGATTLGLVNVSDSSIERETDFSINVNAGPEIGVASTKAFTAQLVALFNIAGLDMKELPAQVEQILSEEEKIKDIAEQFLGFKNSLFMARGINFPIALEGALKLKEISYVHAEGYPAAEMKHGPLALIDKNMPSVFVANEDELFTKVLSNMEEVKARGGVIITVTDSEDGRIRELSDHLIKVPKTHPSLAPLLNVVPLQLLAYHVARLRGRDVDKPRNLAKSVTVE